MALVIQCAVITYVELRKREHSGVTQEEAKQCVRMIRTKFPSRIDRINSLKIVIYNYYPDIRSYGAVAYGFYGGIWKEIDVKLTGLTYQESIEQGVPFSCEGSISSKFW